MSVIVGLTFEGAALGEIPSRDQAEHLARVLREELAKIDGGMDQGREDVSEVKSRQFLGGGEFGAYEYTGRKITFSGSYHVDPPADPPTA